MTKGERLELLKQIEKDIHVCSLESTFLDDAKSCAIHSVIEELEQEPVIDKIRAEIEDLDRFYDNDYFSTNNCPMYKCNEVLLIIDKYKAESEE